MLVAREHAGSAHGLTLAVKGGHNGEHHNHNDVGSFVVASDGVPVIVDAGRPTYTAETFGPRRYDIWTMQSSWHNVPEIDGIAQDAGAVHAASDVVVELQEDRASLTLDLASAYPLAELRSWRRSASLDRRMPRVTIEDSWVLDAGHHAVVRLLLAGSVEVGANSVCVTPLEAATPVRITWPIGAPGRIEVRDLDDPLLSNVWGARLTRLEIDVADLDSVQITVEQKTAEEDTDD